MEKKVEFKVGDETLRGSLFVPSGKGPFPGVIFYHGRGSTRARYLGMAKKLSENGLVTLAFDFRGCGESDGEFKKQTHQMGVEDAKAGLEFLLAQDVDRNRIGIMGTSFGGYVTGMLLNDYDFIKSVVMRAPASYDDKDLSITPETFPEYVYYHEELNWTNSSAYKGIAKFEGSLLVIESEKDEVVPSKLVVKYFNEAKNTKMKEHYVQKNAPHSLKDDPSATEEFNRITVDWFLETL